MRDWDWPPRWWGTMSVRLVHPKRRAEVAWPWVGARQVAERDESLVTADYGQGLETVPSWVHNQQVQVA